MWLIYHLSMAALYFPANNYLFKVNNGNTRTWSEICLKLTIKTPCSSVCWWASNYWRGYLFQANFNLRVVNVRRPILFNIAKNWNQTTFKSRMVGVSAFGWFLVILLGAGWFCAISDYFMICTIYMLYFF